MPQINADTADQKNILILLICVICVYLGLRLLVNIFAVLKKLEACGIEAIPLAGRRRAVGEDVALVAAAAGAANFDTTHSVGIVFDICEMLFVKRCVERRPAGAGVKLFIGAK